MRLLNVETLKMKEFLGSNIPDYAILSHTWGEEEVMLKDIQGPDAQHKKGYAKIMGCREQARMDGIEWIWIDTCCIDKTSSAELSEAINSMFEWYGNSEVCYAYLEDVPPLSPLFPEEQFKKARWFTRGWCLQELLAPDRVEFYAMDWTEIGTKRSLNHLIEDMTGIEKEALLKLRDFGDFNIAQKMSWAATRNTTRAEDEAYCLLGIFNVNMPLLYGEGTRAFLRLQEELLRQTEDYSLLLWTDRPMAPPMRGLRLDGVLSTSPELFQQGSGFEKGRCDFRQIRHFSKLHDPPLKTPTPKKSNKLWNPPQMTSRGLRVQMFVLRDLKSPLKSPLIMWTGYMYLQQYICIMLQRHKGAPFEKYGRVNGHLVKLVDENSFLSFELEEFYLSLTMWWPMSFSRLVDSGQFEVVLSTNCKSIISLIEDDYTPGDFEIKSID
jgi:hypothetical protein